MNPVRVSVLAAGNSRQRQSMAQRGGRWRTIKFPATIALIEHPSGNLLFDTGYAGHYFRSTARFPQRFYRWLVPVELPAGQSAVTQLAGLGLSPEDISIVVVSHLHADHIGGLRDFPGARLLTSASTDLHQGVPGHRATGTAAVRLTRHGFLPELLPEDFFQRREVIEDLPVVTTGLPGFESGFDVFGDQSVIAVPLAGHAEGHFGLWVPATQAEPLFLIGDACWLSTAFTHGLQPPAPVLAMAAHDRPGYHQTVARLATLTAVRDDIFILPSHCAQTHDLARARFGGAQ